MAQKASILIGQGVMTFHRQDMINATVLYSASQGAWRWLVANVSAAWQTWKGTALLASSSSGDDLPLPPMPGDSSKSVRPAGLDIPVSPDGGDDDDGGGKKKKIGWLPFAIGGGILIVVIACIVIGVMIAPAVDDSEQANVQDDASLDSSTPSDDEFPTDDESPTDDEFATDDVTDTTDMMTDTLVGEDTGVITDSVDTDEIGMIEAPIPEEEGISDESPTENGEEPGEETPAPPPDDELADIPEPLASPTPNLSVLSVPVGTVTNGGNLRTEVRVIEPRTVIGQICPGDTVEFLRQDDTWFYIRIAETAANCDPNRVAQGTEGWVSGSLLSAPSGPVPTSP